MLEIVHIPLGIEDPYRTMPCERAPREPQAGQPVTVHMLTRPAGVAREVLLTATVVGQEPLQIAAQRVAGDAEGDRWQAELGAFAVGADASYQAVAYGAPGEQAETACFSFSVTAWHAPRRVVRWEVERDVRFWLAGEQGEESLLTITAISAAELVLRAWPHAPTTAPTPPDGLPFDAPEIADETLLVRGAGLQLRIGLADFAFAVERLDGNGWPLHSAAAWPFLSWLGSVPHSPRAMRLSLALEPDEALYGTGERFDSLDRRGLRFDCRVYEQYKNQGSRTYLPVPLVLSSRGHALFVEGTRPLIIDAGATDPDSLLIEADIARDAAASLAVRLILAPTPLDALKAYLTRSGLPVAPPDWAFGLWMSANDWNSQERVLAEVARGAQEEIPGDVLVIEAWADEATFYIWNDAQYEQLPADRPPRLADFRFPADGHWPDPKGMIDALHEQGIRLLLWQIPLQKQMEEPHAQNAADAAALIERGWCARNPDGSPYRNPGWWFPGALLPDLTNSEAVRWWLSRRRYLVEEMGVDGFKTDGGEHLWGRDIVFADGRHGDELINALPVLYAAAYHQLLAECGREDGLTFSRAGYAGSQRYPAHWAGDENSTWEAFRHSITAGLSAGASGIPFWGWDVAGFSEEIPSGELYRRAWMMATFCPIMQYHSEYNASRRPSRDRTPWNIAERTGDPDVLPVCRRYTAIRRELRPYLVREAAHACKTGRPLMCALSLAYPDDPHCRDYPYQYLLGRDLLVAPTVEEGATGQRVYIPAGAWRDLWTQELMEGPVELKVALPPDYIPVYVREGATWSLEVSPKRTTADA